MKNIKFLAGYGMLISGLIIATACEKNDIVTNQDNQPALFNESSVNDMAILQSSFIETDDLTAEELDMLQHMKEEEKLARDVYYALYAKWKSQIFSNISKAEERHISAVLGLIEFYNLGNANLGNPGDFESEAFQLLYDELVEKGSISLEEAFKVGALIEELDIKDLQDDLEITSNKNISLVFNNLLRGSRNHLRAFDRQLVNLDLAYVAQYLSQNQYDSIVNSSFERGNGQGNMTRKSKGSGNRGAGNADCDGTGINQ